MVLRIFCVHTYIVSQSTRKISRFARNDDTGVRGLLVTSHKSLAIRPCFQIFGAAISRIVIPSAAEGSFLHCGQYHIGIDRETTPWCCVFLLSHMHRLSVCKKDFSLTLEMTIREKGIPKSLKVGIKDWEPRVISDLNTTFGHRPVSSS